MRAAFTLSNAMVEHTNNNIKYEVIPIRPPPQPLARGQATFSTQIIKCAMNDVAHSIAIGTAIVGTVVKNARQTWRTDPLTDNLSRYCGIHRRGC